MNLQNWIVFRFAAQWVSPARVRQRSAVTLAAHS